MTQPHGQSIGELQKILAKFGFSGRSEITPGCDLGEYTGPVEVFTTESESLGFSLRLTRRAERGEILLISKAVAACIREYEVVPRWQGDPSKVTACFFGQPVMPDRESSAHTEDEDQSDTDNAIDSRRVPAEVSELLIRGIRKWVTSTARAFQILSLQNDTHSRDRQKTLSEAARRLIFEDEHFLPGVIARNAAYDDVSWEADPKVSEVDHSLNIKNAEFWGLWLMPSLINHSCTPNCLRQRMGDYLIIRASMDIEPKQLLSLPYYDIFKPLPVREKSSKQWGFRCSCTRCEVERGLEDPIFQNISFDLVERTNLLEVAWRETYVTREISLQLLEDMADITVALKDELEKLCLDRVSLNDDSRNLKEHESNAQHLKATGSTSGDARSPEAAESEWFTFGIPQNVSEMDRTMEASESFECLEDKKTRRAEKKKKKKAKKKEQKEQKKAEVSNEASFWDPRSCIMDAAARRTIAAAEDRIRKIFVDAALEELPGSRNEREAAVRLWGYTDTNPFDEIWAHLNMDLWEQNFRENPVPFYIKASYIDAYMAAYALEIARATVAAIPKPAEVVVRRIHAISIILDMLSVAAVISGYSGLIEEFAIDFGRNCEELLSLNIEEGSVVIAHFTEKIQQYVEFLADKFFGYSAS